MKLRWYDRILISLGGLVLMATGVCAVLVGSGAVKPEWFALDSWIGSGWQWMPIIVLAGLLFVAWGGWLFVMPFLRQRARGGKYYTVQGSNDEDGVHISMQALDHLVHRALSVWPEILVANVKIGGQEDAMRITLRTTLQSNVRIPELIGDVRSEIKQYVEECAGVKVASVKVIVEATKDTRAQQQKDAGAQAPAGALLGLESAAKPVPEPEPAPQAPEAPGFAPSVTVRREPDAPPPALDPVPEPDAVTVSNADFGPREPLPVTLSGDAFPFPQEDEIEAEADGAETAQADEVDWPEHTEEETPDA